jgi:hypothetical protein
MQCDAARDQVGACCPHALRHRIPQRATLHRGPIGVGGEGSFRLRKVNARMCPAEASSQERIVCSSPGLARLGLGGGEPQSIPGCRILVAEHLICHQGLIPRVRGFK